MPTDRVPAGVRVSASLYSDYKRLCLRERIRPNEVVEATMKRAVDTGDLKGVLKLLGSSASEDLVSETDLSRSLDELERLVGNGWFQAWQHKEGKGEFPQLDQQVDKLICDIQEMLPRCHEPKILSRAKWLLPRAAFYFGMERWANTAGSKEGYRLQEAYESLARKSNSTESLTEESTHSTKESSETLKGS